jgi:NAD(P)-dependent dehydrogenase (short-subunit alcohol dehydrogenase family)
MSPPGLESELSPSPKYRAPYYRGSGKLEGKTALVTGGDSGIGRAVAVLFAREGADVAIVCLPQEASDAAQTVAAIEEEGRRGLAIVADLRDGDACEEVVAQTVQAFGGLDVLVNNAAFQNHASLDELDLAQWQRTLDTNLTGMFRVTMAALPHLSEGSAIINTGSITGLEGSAGLLDYATTKGGIHAFTKTLAQMLSDRGIRVNCVAPGPVWTPLNPAERSPDEVECFGADTPMGRPAQPEEIAPAYVYFASEQTSSWVSGEVLTLLGGATRAG